MKKIAKYILGTIICTLTILGFKSKVFAVDFLLPMQVLEEDFDFRGYFKYCPYCGNELYDKHPNEFEPYNYNNPDGCLVHYLDCFRCGNIYPEFILKAGHRCEIVYTQEPSQNNRGYIVVKCEDDGIGHTLEIPSLNIQEEKESEGIYWEDPITVAQHNAEPEIIPEPEPEPYKPQPIIIYDGMETISENSLRFYEDVGNQFRELNGNVYAQSLSLNRIDNRLQNIDNKLATLDEIKDLTASVSSNTAELVRLSKNDINNEEMLNQLSGNIEDLNTRLTELSVYLGYFFAFMIFLIIVIIFRATWKLIDKYLLNQTLR